jgi:CRP-like cAMP-binding protein
MKSSLDILQSIELFQGLTTEDLQKILKIGQEESFSAGEVIFREGDLAENSTSSSKVRLKFGKITACLVKISWLSGVLGIPLVKWP